MIRTYHGLPGGGKSYAVQKDEVIDELLFGKRFIVFDFAVKLKELDELLNPPTRKNDSALVDVYGRCRILTPAEASEFWRYPKPGLDIPNVTTEKKTIPDYSGFGEENPVTENGTLYIIDEAHIKFDARAWKTTGDGLTFYCSQHRKLNDEVIFLTQHLSQLESRIRNVTELFVDCTNSTNRRIFSIFRRPSKLKQEWRYKYPGPVDRTVEYKLDLAVANTYYTMTGHGISGRVKPEEKRIKGLPVWLLAIPILAGVYLMTKAPEWVGAGISAAMKKVAGKGTEAVASVAPPPPIPAQTGQNLPSCQVQTQTQAPKPLESRLFVEGWLIRGGVYNVMMSNGEVWTEQTPGMRREDGARITRTGLWKGGVFYPLKPSVKRRVAVDGGQAGGGAAADPAKP